MIGGLDKYNLNKKWSWRCKPMAVGEIRCQKQQVGYVTARIHVIVKMQRQKQPPQHTTGEEAHCKGNAAK